MRNSVWALPTDTVYVPRLLLTDPGEDDRLLTPALLQWRANVEDLRQTRIPFPERTGPTGLCAICKQIDISVFSSLWIRDGLVRKPTSDTNKEPWLELGTLDSIYSKTWNGCSLCMFIHRLASSAKVDATLPLYLLRRYTTHTAKNENISVRKPRAHNTVYFARFLLSTEKTAQPTVDDIVAIFNLADPRTKDVYHELYREPAHRSFWAKLQNDTVNARQMRKWLKVCDEGHPRCGGDRVPPQNGVQERRHIRVIDVETKRIVLLPAGSPYVALSYRWGDSRGHIRLEKDNLEQFSTDGLGDLDWGELPRTISDAMEVVEMIHCQYLWVDKLCIVQDDHVEKHNAISNMADIYGGSYVTIVAADGDADTGILGLHAYGRRWRPEVAAVGDVTLVQLEHSEIRQRKLDAAKYSTRGWTFQEYILSPRVLVFLEGRVHLKCRSARFYEDVALEDPTFQPLTDDDMYGTFHAKKGRIHQDDLTYEGYKSLVSRYSCRELTYPEDILKAFAGVGSLLSSEMKTKFHYGLPVAYFDCAILWRPEEALNSRAGFPSWAWSGWIGRVGYWPSYHFFKTPEQWLERSTYIIWGLSARGVTVAGIEYSRRRLAKIFRGYVDDGLGWLNAVPASVRFSLFTVSRGFSSHGKDCPRLRFWCLAALFKLDADTLPSVRRRDPKAAPYRVLEFPQPHRRYDIRDKGSRFCGTIVLDEDYGYSSDRFGHVYEFLILSEAEQYVRAELVSVAETCHLRNRDVINGFMFPFVNVMMVDYREGVCRRAGVGLIYKTSLAAAFAGGPVWKEMVLA